MWKGTKAGQLIPSGSKDIPYSISYGVMLNNKTGRELAVGGWQPTANGLAGQQSAGGEQLHNLFCICYYYYYYFPFTVYVLLNCLYLLVLPFLQFSSPSY